MTTLALPNGFRFGVTTAGSRVEGGFNGPGEPANTWFDWEAAGRVDPSGVALGFWDRYDTVLDRAVAAGCDAFRLSVEWARCEPAPGEIDDAAFERYGAILDACHDRNLLPVVTLLHGTHPRWAGTDLWLRIDAPERFAAWAAVAADRLAGRCRHWITIDTPNAAALASFVTGTRPPGRRRDVAALVRSLDHQLTGHVLAYDAVKARQPQATVTMTTAVRSAYELDAMSTDVLLSRSLGVDRHDVRPWLEERRRRHREAWEPRGTVARAGAAAVRRLAATTIPLEQALPRTLGAVHGAAAERTLDVIAVDHDVAHLARHLVPHRGGRRPWDDPVDPSALLLALRLARDAAPGLAVWVTGDGIAGRTVRGVTHRRPDGRTRVRHLKEHLAAVAAAHDDGVPVTAYFHRTLADDWADGTYEARFGLHAVDRERGLRWSTTDGFGDDAAGAFRTIASGLRQGDRSVLR